MTSMTRTIDLARAISETISNKNPLDYTENFTVMSNRISLLASKSKPLQIYFQSPNSNDVTKLDPSIVVNYNNILPVDVIVCNSWDELYTLLEKRPDEITINSNVFSMTDLTTIKETTRMLQTKLKLIELDIPIALVVDRKTSKNIVIEAKKLGFQCMVPYYGDWNSVDIMKGLQALTDRTEYWPEHIINQLPKIEEKPIHVVFRKDCHEIVTSHKIAQIENTSAKGLTVRCASTWDELGEVLRENPYQISAHTDMISVNGVTVHEFMSMITTMIKVITDRKIPIAIVIEKTTPMSVIKELQKSDVHGIIPSSISFDLSESLKGIEALFNRIPYWPKHILEQLPGAKKTVTKNSIVLTPRQAQIVDLIKERGLSNKKIAQSLNITESTVKIHVSAILKAYGVRTRTQLAVVTNR